MAVKYLDETGLAYLWAKIKAYVDNHAGSGTPTPTANATSAFDSSAKMNSTDMTSAQVSDFVDSLNASGTGIVNLIYPVGSVYISTNSTSPATLFGGTWVQIKGRFLLGTGTPDANTTAYWGTDITNLAGDSLNSPVREMGGESKHTLDVNQIPSHRHAAVFVAEGSGDFLTFQGANRVGDTNPWAYGSYAGGGGAHNNMPPYFAVYMWERTA